MRGLLAALLILVLSVGPIVPAYAHKGHERNQAAEAQPIGPTKTSNATAPARAAPAEARSPEPERKPLPTFERLLDWLGRLHPSIVHFPLALLPTALLTAIAGRRRTGLDEVTRFLILAGGLAAPVAMLLGWLDGGWSLWDKDQILAIHRWLGTAIGIGGLGLAAWVLARPHHVKSNAMLTVLTIMTAAILVQGWHGGALIHGTDHLDW
jgi:uncharacterized membrane protein